MSMTPFHDIADELDAVSKKLTDLADQWTTGNLTVGETPPDDTDKSAPSTSKSGK